MMPCLFESERVSVSVRDISLLRQNCRAEFFSPHEKNMPCWFHLISDHRLHSQVIIRKYLLNTWCQQHYIMVEENHSCNVETTAFQKYVTFEKCTQAFAHIARLYFFSKSNQLVWPASCQQPNHQITYIQHIWNQMWTSYHNNPTKSKLFAGRGVINEGK